MANQFEVLGSNNDKPHKAVPLAVSQLFSGYWPNSAPYRDAAVQYLYLKFYGAARNDKIAAGLNTEISPRLTLIRRPGCTVCNDNNFTDVVNFYSFRPFESSVGEQVLVIVDTATAVYVASINGTPCKTLLYTKAAGAGISRLKGEGNSLFWGDGVSTKKWTWFPSWVADTPYTTGTCVLDSANNIQECLGYAVLLVSTSVSSNIITIDYSGTGTINQGDSVTFYGLTQKTGLNGATLKVLTSTTGSFTAAYVTANYSTTAESGIAVDLTQTAAPTSGTVFSGGSVVQSVSLDTGGTAGWISWGNAVQDMGIVAPTVAPTVQTVAVAAEPAWAASTYYWPQPFILDSNTSTGPWVWQLTTSGTTASSVPSGLTTGTPTPNYSGGVASPTPTTVTDGTAVWTCNSLATRAISTAYMASCATGHRFAEPRRLSNG
jgi:hypothetical protein